MSGDRNLDPRLLGVGGKVVTAAVGDDPAGFFQRLVDVLAFHLSSPPDSIIARASTCVNRKNTYQHIFFKGEISIDRKSVV